MDIWALLLLAIGLSMDAFAVSICKGLAMKKITWQKSGVVGLWFGGFQALMPRESVKKGAHAYDRVFPWYPV